jgi:N-acetylglucosamine-6-phosphate deacetylase
LQKTCFGRTAAGSSVLRIEYGSVIGAVDELIQRLELDEIVAPGLIDVQVNGFAGVDYNDPSASSDAIAGSIRKIFETGVTRFFPTIITGSEEHITAALRNLARTREQFSKAGSPEGEAIAGFHIEGPHISPETGPRGAHPAKHVRPPDLNEFERWQDAASGNIRLVTISPEWDGTPEYIRELVRRGVVCSIGHTKATGEQIRVAVEAGATMSTHLGNGAHASLAKTDNYIWHQLADERLTPSFIVDGIHLPSAFFRSAVRAKGVENSVLVTDAVAPAMCAPGPYMLGEVSVELRPEGRVVMRGEERLAGSALRMDDAVANAVRLGGVSLSQALAMATVNPARVGRIAGRQRGLTPGDKADFVRFTWDAVATSFTVVETILGGTSVYHA